MTETLCELHTKEQCSFEIHIDTYFSSPILATRVDILSMLFDVQHENMVFFVHCYNPFYFVNMFICLLHWVCSNAPLSLKQIVLLPYGESCWNICNCHVNYFTLVRKSLMDKLCGNYKCVLITVIHWKTWVYIISKYTVSLV